MCVGIPARILKVDGIAGHVTDGQHHEIGDFSLTPEAGLVDGELNLFGAAREAITQNEAQKTTAALVGLQALMQGGDLGHAFVELEAREPGVPGHLQADLDAGKSTA